MPGRGRRPNMGSLPFTPNPDSQGDRDLTGADPAEHCVSPLLSGSVPPRPGQAASAQDDDASPFADTNSGDQRMRLLPGAPGADAVDGSGRRSRCARPSGVPPRRPARAARLPAAGTSR